MGLVTMLSLAQRKKIFTEIATAYTVNGTAFTATKTWREQWSGIIETPVIVLYFSQQSKLAQSTVGRRAEWRTDSLAVDIFARSDITSGVHGGDIVETIASFLEDWFATSGTAALYGDGMSVVGSAPVEDLSFLEDGVYRRMLEIDILYKMI